MQTKRDQLQAHVFVVTRLVSALLRADPDQLERPMRRTATGGFIGVALAVVVMLGFGVYGFVRGGGNDSWREAGSIIVEKETGGRYVYLDGTLRPVLNYTSARLAAGGAEARVRVVSAASLLGVPHGRAIGIPGAPEQLPEPGSLRSGSWLACLSPVAGQTAPRVAIAVDAGWAAEDLPDDQALLVADDSGRHHLVFRGRRLAIADTTALLALGYGSAVPSRVPSGWLNAFEEGPQLRAPAVPRRGRIGPAVGTRKTRIGQILQVTVPGGDPEFYLVLADGLVPVTPTVARLLLTDPGTAAAYRSRAVEPIVTSAGEVVRAPRSTTALAVTGLPDRPPRLAAGLADGRSWCARMTFDAARGATVVPATVASSAVTGIPTGATGGRVADLVKVAPGAGALVATQAAPGVPTGTVYLITDLGVRYPLADADVTAALGYAGVPAVPVPTSVLAMVPAGPTLDAVAARTEPGAD